MIKRHFPKPVLPVQPAAQALGFWFELCPGTYKPRLGWELSVSGRETDSSQYGDCYY